MRKSHSFSTGGLNPNILAQLSALFNSGTDIYHPNVEGHKIICDKVEGMLRQL